MRRTLNCVTVIVRNGKKSCSSVRRAYWKDERTEGKSNEVRERGHRQLNLVKGKRQGRTGGNKEKVQRTVYVEGEGVSRKRKE